MTEHKLYRYFFTPKKESGYKKGRQYKNIKGVIEITSNQESLRLNLHSIGTQDTRRALAKELYLEIIELVESKYKKLDGFNGKE